MGCMLPMEILSSVASMYYWAVPEGDKMKYGFAAFRSRQHTFSFEDILKKRGFNVSIINTPRQAKVGCGVSIKFDLEDYKKVLAMYKKYNPKNFVGFYCLDTTKKKDMVIPIYKCFINEVT